MREKELAVQVEGKPSVYSQLEAGRASKVRESITLPTVGWVVCWKQMQTTRHHTSSSLAPAAASASAEAASSGESTVIDVIGVFEYRGKEYIRADRAKAVVVPKFKDTKADQKNAHRVEMQRQHYAKQIKDGRLHAGPTAV